MLRQLLRIAGWPQAKLAASEGSLVTDMRDGGMGSVRFLHPSLENDSRRMGARIAEIEFSDVDGVTVIASLNVDQSGELFELDIWRTDFGKLISYPRSGYRRGEVNS